MASPSFTSTTATSCGISSCSRSSRLTSRTVDPDSNRLRVSVSDGTGRAVRDGGLARWLAAIAPPRADGDVGIALVSDARMRALNRTYRRKDFPTDVLSFSAAAREPAGSALGDIVIAT